MMSTIAVILMPDNHSPEVRSYNMSRIRSTNTKPEERVRKALFSRGFRYRKNDKRYPGKPDLVLPKYHAMVFINGCFWHMHDCPGFVWPKSRLDYWRPKLLKNAERDRKNYAELKEKGWNVIVIWECQLNKESFESTMDEVSLAIKNPSAD